SVLGEISRAKDKMQSPDMFKNNAGSDLRLSEISKVYEIYQKRLRIANALDFDDIIMHTVTLLLKFSEVREYYQKKFKYVLVDEYQDTNHAQYLLASTLSGGYDNICVVGDDDQSIYRFRGATVENILEFENRYKGAKAIRLEQNYRSSTNILNIANSVISHNRGRKEKKLWTENPAGDLPSICRTQSETTEGQMVADKIVEEYSKGKGKWSDFAILYRINAQSNQLENGLKRRNVPYRIIGGTRFFDHTEIKDMLSYLWVVHNPSDTLRIKRIINVPARKIGQKTIEAIDELSRENNMSFFEVLDKAAVFSELHRALPQLQAFATLIDSLRALVNTIPLSELYDKLVAESGYIDALIAKDDIKTRTRIENIQELKSNIIMFENESEEPTLGAFLDEVSLFTDIEKYDAD
ncbi:MAG: UvrD-helicase domain-containing protein, partial [Clostridia bacterium]